MAGTGSPTPYIKEEYDDMQHNRFINHNGFDMNQQFGTQPFSSGQDHMGGINPSDLTMSGSINMNNQFNSASYGHGGAGIPDDELVESLGNFEHPQGFNNFNQDGMEHQENFFPGHTNGVQGSANHPSINQMYSNTPDDLPIQSPFVQPQGFDFSQYQSTPQRMGFPAGSMARPRIPSAMSRNGSDNRSPMSPKTPALAGLP